MSKIYSVHESRILPTLSAQDSDVRGRTDSKRVREQEFSCALCISGFPHVPMEKRYKSGPMRGRCIECAAASRRQLRHCLWTIQVGGQVCRRFQNQVSTTEVLRRSHAAQETYLHRSDCFPDSQLQFRIADHQASFCGQIQGFQHFYQPLAVGRRACAGRRG